MLDTGAANDGVDELAIYGCDNTDPRFNGYVPGHADAQPTDDIFLLRAMKCIDTEAPYGLTTPASPCRPTATSPTETADQPAFVALLHGDDDPDGGLGRYRDRLVGDEPSSLVQRINYDAALNGRLTRLRPRRQRRLLRRRQHARSRRSTAARATTSSRSARSSASSATQRRGRACCRRTPSRC